MCFMFQSINALEILHSVEGKCQVDNKSVDLHVTRTALNPLLYSFRRLALKS